MLDIQKLTKNQSNLSILFWGGATTLLLYSLSFETETIWLNLASILIIAMALLPTYLWFSGKALGTPIFPLFSLTFIWTYALPLISDHSDILEFSVHQRFNAALTTAGFLLLSCLVWFIFVRKSPSPPKAYRCLNSIRGNRFFILALIISICFNVANIGGMFTVLSLTGGEFAILTNTVIAFTSLSSFLMAFRLGKKELSQKTSVLVVILLLLLVFTSALTFLLVTPAVIFLSSIIAFTIGRGKFPISLFIIGILCFSILHVGKGEMRKQYWPIFGQTAYIQVWQYPSVYQEWIQYGINNLSSSLAPTIEVTNEPQSFTERASVIQMLLKTQSLSPQVIPYLNGYSYAFLPQMLVPRILYPGKPLSHEGTYRLNIHYGRQTREDTRTTTIGWGLLAESYANFGLIGCFGLAIILGAIYGQIGRMSINAPVLSLPSLLAVFFMTYAIQTEWTAGVYIAALAQHGFVLAVFAILFMKRRPNEQLNKRLIDNHYLPVPYTNHS